MAREFIFIAQDEAGFQLGSSGAVVLLCVIAVCLSIISMVVFSCADCPEKDPDRKGGGGGSGGNVAGGGGCGGCGGACGGDGGCGE